MTEAEAERVEEEWKAYHERRTAIAVLQSVGLSERDLEREIGVSKATDAAAVVVLLTEVAATAEDLNSRRIAFHQLATYAERDGQPFHDLLAESIRCSLLAYKPYDAITNVEIRTAGPTSACAACETQNGKIFTVDDALALMPLPCAECTHTIRGDRPGFCRCEWLPQIKKTEV